MSDYSIQDPQSGKTVTVSGDHAPTQQDAEEIFQKAGLRTQNSSQPSDEGAFTHAMNGAYNVPVLGGIARGITQPLNTLVETGVDDVRAALHKISGDKTPFQPHFISQDEQQALLSPEARQANPVTNALGYEAKQLPSQALSLLSLEGGPSLAKGGINLVKGAAEKTVDAADLIKTLIQQPKSFSGLYKNMESAVSDTSLDWENVSKLARDAVIKKSSATKKALEDLLTEQGPTPNAVGEAGTEDISNTLSGQQALDTRVELGKRLPHNFFEKLTSKVTPAETEANDILRRTLSTELKRVAPDIKDPDAVYHFYASKLHGDLPTTAKRIIAAELLKHLGGQIPGLGTLLKAIPAP